jgi:hypothetical protein
MYRRTERASAGLAIHAVSGSKLSDHSDQTLLAQAELSAAVRKIPSSIQPAVASRLMLSADGRCEMRDGTSPVWRENDLD